MTGLKNIFTWVWIPLMVMAILNSVVAWNNYQNALRNHELQMELAFAAIPDGAIRCIGERVDLYADLRQDPNCETKVDGQWVQNPVTTQERIS